MQLQTIQNKIYEIRGHKVMLDFDLAQLYETETRVLKQAVRRNIERFPSDFMFELTKEEYDCLRVQGIVNYKDESLRSQIVTLKVETLETNRGKHSKYLPFAFTEQGVAMLASVLKSTIAIQVNIQIIRAFVFLRQYALTHKDLTEKLKELESQYNQQFKDVYEAINYLLQKDKQETDQKERTRIGFKDE